MKKPDVIILLGGGVNGTLQPVLYTKGRLETLMRYYRRVPDTPIIASGGYAGILKRRPRYTEAQVMKKYLLSHNVPSKYVYLEERSRDTLGNAYYSKQIIKRFPLWRNLLVVTDAEHADRMKWIFKKIFGPSYSISLLASPHSPEKNKKGRKQYERYLTDLYRQMLQDCLAGDDKAILRKLRGYHPYFSKSSAAKKIGADIREHKLKLLGYLTRSKSNWK